MSGRGALTVMFALFLGVSLCALFLAAQLRDPYSAEPRMITIRVDDHRGRPIPDGNPRLVRLTFVDLNGRRLSTTDRLSADGVFREPHPGVPCDVVVAAVGHEVARFPLEQDEHTIRLKPGLAIEIACRPSDGGAWRDWQPRIRVRGAPKPGYRYWPGDGHVAASEAWFERERTATWNVVRPDPRTGVIRCRVPAAGTYSVRIDLHRADEKRAVSTNEAGISVGGNTHADPAVEQPIRELRIDVGARRRFEWLVDVRRLDIAGRR